MAARDPETGQFVASAGGVGRAYGELDVQTVIATLDDPDSSHTDQLEVFEQLQAFEPLGGLARAEVAELVHLRSEAVLGYSSIGNDAASMEMEGSLSFDSTMQTELQTADTVTETDIVTGIDTRLLDTVDIDILDRFQLIANTQVEDNTNGDGAGADSMVRTRELPFRALFAGGPVVDRHDELFIHAALNERGTPSSFEYQHIVTLVWDVRERDR